MRTMLNPGSQLSNPAEYFINWSGKVEKIKNSKGEIEKEGGFFFWKDADNEYAPVKLETPAVFYPLGESMSITGGIYDAATNSGTFLSSNEFGDWAETITVYEKEPGGNSQRIARGPWADIKDVVKEHGGKIQTNLYALAKIKGDDPSIVRLQIKGGSSYALSNFRKKQGKNFYEQTLRVTGAEFRVNGVVDYAVPVFEAGDRYDEETVKALQEYAKIISEYGQALAARNAESANLPTVIDDNGEVTPQDNVPTTEEVDQMINDAEEVDLNNIPF